MQLTNAQQKIVKLTSGEHLVLAPPGTGKTQILTYRIEYALSNGFEPDDMVCLTFTNRAARNMIDRVEQSLGRNDIFIGNIHSFCNYFLRRVRAIPHNASLLDEDDIDSLIYEVLETIKIEVKYNTTNGEAKIRDIKVSEAKRLLSQIKMKRYNFEDELIGKLEISFATKESKDRAIELFERVEQIKKESNFIDYDDLLIETYRYLTTYSFKGYKWIEIDEVQDLNPMQWAIVEKISSDDAHRVYFGDYEQAIFSFMGAKIEVLDKISARCKMHFLRENFRSPQYLLDLFNRFAKSWLTPKWEYEPISMINSTKPKGALGFREVIIQHEDGRYSTAEDEANWIVTKKLPNEPKEPTAILVRKNSQADIFAELFTQRGTPYFKISGEDLFRRKEIKDILAFFRIIADRDDRGAWIRIFHIYAKNALRSLKSAREFVNSIYRVGIHPFDFTFEKPIYYLDGFNEILLKGRVVVFDTETTGLDTKSDDIIQIAAIEIVGGKIGRSFEVYIDTDKDITSSQKVHHISKERLKELGVDRKVAFEKFLEFVGDSALVAHNLEYDFEILQSNLDRVGLALLDSNIAKYDSIEITKRLYPKLPSYRLEYLIDRFNIEGVNSHNALDDVKATVNLILYLSNKISSSIKDREEIFSRYESIQRSMYQKFRPLYRSVEGEFGKELPLGVVVDMVMGYMIDKLNYKTDDEIFKELEKLTHHMDSRTITTIYDAIIKYIPEYSRYNEADLISGDEKILIATIHKAKGLEFANVVIPFCTDDEYPSYYEQKSGNIIESARLLYVAMTRAKKRLFITSHTKKIISGVGWKREFNIKPSRFLAPVMGLLRD